MGVWTFVLFVWVVSLRRINADDTCLLKPGPGYCSCTTLTNHVVDLSNIRIDLHPGVGKPTFGDIGVATSDYVYSYSPCTSFTEGTCKDVSVCQKSRDGKHQYGAGQLRSAIFSGDLFKDELRVSYTSDHESSRNSTILLKCSVDESGRLEAHGETSSKHYEFVLHTKYVCLESSQAGGLSTGSILLILCSVAVVVYLVGGMLLKHFIQGATGWEQVPNVNFWRDLPSLVKDGGTFCIGLCIPKRSYEAI